MKKRLSQALESLHTRTCKKYVTLFSILIFSFFFVNSARAESTPSPREQDGKTIAVQAIVPLTPEFVYSIKKNASLLLEKSAFVLGEEIRVQVRIAGGNDEPLLGHKIRLQAVNVEREELLTLYGETDIDGLAYFTFVADADFLGDGILRVIDVTYDAPILLHQEHDFIVYEAEDGQKHREQATKSGFSGSNVPASGQTLLVSVQSGTASDISQNNGTIAMMRPGAALARAGPDDP